MLLLTLLRLVLAVGVLIVLPGWLLLNAVFPRSRGILSWPERVFLALAGGTLVLMLVGCILGFLPHDGEGYFRMLATGSPNVEVATLAGCVILAYVGLQRGCYPAIRARWPRLMNPEAKV